MGTAEVQSLIVGVAWYSLITRFLEISHSRRFNSDTIVRSSNIYVVEEALQNTYGGTGFEKWIQKVD